jgi:ribA/ribD-fused uncharacterized protein
MSRVIDDFFDDYYFLSNFYSAPTEFEGVVYPTSENAYQAAKTTHIRSRKTFADPECTPAWAKRLGRSLDLRPDWEEVKEQVMRDCLKSKFSDPALRALLQATGDAVLIEGNTWHDNIWGVCTCHRCPGNGQNLLGQLLEELRGQ